MGSGLEDIISRLEQQRSAIESALTALRDLGGSSAANVAPAASAPAARSRARRKGRMTPEGRKRLADAMKKRWAVKRTAAQAKKSASKKAAAKKAVAKTKAA